MSQDAAVNLHASVVRSRIKRWLNAREARIQSERTALIGKALAERLPATFCDHVMSWIGRPYNAKTRDQIETLLADEFHELEFAGGLWKSYALKLEAAALAAHATGDKFITVPSDWVLVFGLHKE